MTVHVRRKVTYGGADAAVERAAVRQMSAETHSRGANKAIAGGKGEKGGDGDGSVFVISGDFLPSKKGR